MIKHAKIVPASQLLDVFHHIAGQRTLDLYQAQSTEEQVAYANDLQDVVGQAAGKRALEIAAAGGHNLLFTGPPGTGKTMLASRLITILPPMTDEEALASAAIHSIVGKPVDPQHGNNEHFAIHITPAQPLLWLEVAVYLGQVKFHWRTTAYYS